MMGAFASTYKRANVFTHCTAEASLYERAPADRTTSNTVVTPTPANAASAKLCQSKSLPSVTMQAPESTTNDEQHSASWPNSARATHTSPGTSTPSPNPPATIPAPITAPKAAPNADCTTPKPITPPIIAPTLMAIILVHPFGPYVPPRLRRPHSLFSW